MVAPLNWTSRGAVHALWRERVPVVAVAPRGHEVTRSRLCRKVLFDPRDDSTLWEALREARDGDGDRPVLFWGDDAAILIANDRQDELAKDFRFLMPPPNVTRRLADKTEFAAWADAKGFRTPETHVVSTADEWDAAIESARLPCVAKPRFRSVAWEQSGLPKVFRAHTRDELRAVRDATIHVEPSFVIQEWIPGPDSNIVFHLAYYGPAGDHVAGFTGRKLRQWPVDVGYTSAAEPLDDPEVEGHARRILDEAGLRGLGSVEFKRDGRDGSLVIMEPTVGRVNAQSEVATMNGVNLVYRAYCDLVGIEPRKAGDPRRPVRIFFLRTDLKSASVLHKRGELSWIDFLKTYRGRRYYAEFCRSDPLPFATAFARTAIRKLRMSRRRK